MIRNKKVEYNKALGSNYKNVIQDELEKIEESVRL